LHLITTAQYLDALRRQFDRAAQTTLHYANSSVAFSCGEHPPFGTTDTIGGSRALNELVQLLHPPIEGQRMLLDHLTDVSSFTVRMANNNNFFSTSSPGPTMVMPPAINTNPMPDQYFANGHYTNGNSSATTPYSNPFTPTTGSIPPTPGSLAGRKRSRGDIHAGDDEEDAELEDGSVTTPLDGEVAKPRGKPVYGPGMTLIYPEDPGYEAAAESQSGTWLDEQAVKKAVQCSHAKRPSISSRKSARRDHGASLSAGQDDLAQLVLPPQIREAAQEHLIDEATRVLGISWKRMDGTEVGRISQSAYTKFIERHYPGLKEVAVWFENSAIPGYLVEARNGYSGEQGWYIFSHDLTEARLVTIEPAQLVPRLKMLHMGLEVAAPGGHLRAEMDPATAAQNEVDKAQEALTENRNAFASNGVNDTQMSVDDEPSSAEPYLKSLVQDSAYAHGQSKLVKADSLWEPSGLCAAHEMEMD
jgi:hypothetical protein